MTEKKTTRTLKSDTVPKAKRLVTENNEPCPKASDKAVGSTNAGQKVDSSAAIEDPSSHQEGYMKDVSQYDAQHCGLLVAPVAAITPFDARPRAQQYILPVGQFGGTQPIASFVRQPQGPFGIQAGVQPGTHPAIHPHIHNIHQSTQRANPYTEEFFRDVAWTVTQNFPWELFAQEHGCTVPEVSVAFCALVFAILGDPEFIWKKEEHLTTAQFGNMMIREWWDYYLSVLKPRGRMYQMMQPPTRTTIFTPSRGMAAGTDGSDSVKGARSSGLRKSSTRKLSSHTAGGDMGRVACQDQGRGSDDGTSSAGEQEPSLKLCILQATISLASKGKKGDGESRWMAVNSDRKCGGLG